MGFGIQTETDSVIAGLKPSALEEVVKKVADTPWHSLALQENTVIEVAGIVPFAKFVQISSQGNPLKFLSLFRHSYFACYCNLFQLLQLLER